MTEFVDAKARDKILGAYETTLFVEAAAGTGKTTVLVGRIVGLNQSVGQRISTLHRAAVGDLRYETNSLRACLPAGQGGRPWISVFFKFFADA
jgi:hypothetical protein